MERCSVWDGIWIERGGMADYEGLSEFHYRGGRPGGVMRVWVARYAGKTNERKTKYEGGSGRDDAGRRVLVECLPAALCTLRSVALSGRYCGDGAVFGGGEVESGGADDFAGGGASDVSGGRRGWR